jgi:hypothetical protein
MTNVVNCFDGSGGDVRAHGNTNVVQLFGRLRNEPDEQLTYYDHGVGTFAAVNGWRSGGSAAGSTGERSCPPAHIGDHRASGATIHASVERVCND